MWTFCSYLLYIFVSFVEVLKKTFISLFQRETAQQLPNFPDQTEVKQETQQLLEKELQQGTKPDVLEKEELNDKTKRSQGLVNLKPEFAENEDFQAETKPSLSEREIEGVEEDLVPETKPVQRSKETEEKLEEEEEEEESPQTKPSQRSTESKPETKPSPKFVSTCLQI